LVLFKKYHHHIAAAHQSLRAILASELERLTDVVDARRELLMAFGTGIAAIRTKISAVDVFGAKVEGHNYPEDQIHESGSNF
jgi:hypothetical protein